MRNARDQYLQHFGKIGTGDVILLQQEIDAAIDKEKQDREKAQKGEETATSLDVTRTNEDRGASPLIPEGFIGNDTEPDKMVIVAEGKDAVVKKLGATATDAQSDVKMGS